MAIFADKTKGGRSNGKFRIDVTVGGKRLQRRASSYAAAQTLEAMLLGGKELAYVNPLHTLGWLADQRAYIWEGCKDDDQPRRLCVCVDLLGRDKPITLVTTIHLHEMRKQLLLLRPKRKCHRPASSPQTIHRYMSAISRGLTWCEEQGILDRPPSIPWPKLTKPVKRFFTVHEEAQVCQWFLERGELDKATLIRVLAQTGLRAGELWKLRPEHVSDGYVCVGDWDGGTKTADHRYVPISEPLGRALTALLASGLPSYRAMLKGLHGACEATGVDPRKTLHKLRHTTATRLNDAGVNVFTIKSFMGHKSLTTTEGYTSVQRKSLTAASRLLPITDGGGGPSGGERPFVTVLRPANPLIMEASPGIEPGCTDLQGDPPPSSLTLRQPSVNEGDSNVDTSWIDLLA